MTQNSRKNNASKFIRSVSTHGATLLPISGSNELVKKNASYLAGFFCLACILLIVGVWQLASAHSNSKADSMSTPDVNNGSALNSNVDSKDGVDSGSNNGLNVNVQKDGDGPAKVTVNGQPVDVPDSGSVNRDVGSNDNNASVNININNGGTTNGSSSHTYSHSSTHVYSNNQSSNLNINTRSSTSN